MPRRGLRFVLAFVIGLVGYQPYLGTTAYSAVPTQMFVSTGSSEEIADDCCDETGKAKRLCLWSDACIARCHINAGLEAVSVELTRRLARANVASLIEQRSQHKARVGPLFRPPII
jgi:hypothetical protein